jgi:hypothetical protein
MNARRLGGQPEDTLASRVASVIKAQRYRYADEAHLQEAIAGALAAAGIEAVREVRLAPADKIDFMVGSLGIEVKIAGQSPAVARQLLRYAKSEVVAELMLVTTRPRHRDMPRDIGGKAVHVVWLSGITS